MRAVFLQIFLFMLPPTILFAAQVGPLAYYWYTWMNPHRLVFITLNFQWGKIIAITTLIIWIFSRNNRSIVWNYVTINIVVLYIWTIITTYFSEFQDPAYNELQMWSKIVLMCIISTALMQTRARLHALIWILVLSIGYIGVKGGIFVLITTGNHLILGPAGTSIAETNEIARALLMTIPLAFYLYLHSYWKIIRIAMLVVTLLLILSLIGTNSRGALVALVGMAFYAWLYSRRKIRVVLAVTVIFAAVVSMIGTDRLTGLADRFSTISQYDEDSSFKSRLDAWDYATDVAAKSPFVGNGFGTFLHGYRRAAHSNYFQVLGQHGYVGLVLYILLCVGAFFYCGGIISKTKSRPELYWARDLAFMLRCAIVGYLIGGITKNHAFFEMFYMELMMLVVTGAIVKREVANFAELEQSKDQFASSPQPLANLR